MPTQEITITGIHCKSCTMLIEDALAENGAKNINIKADFGKKICKAVFESDKPKTAFTKAIKQLGDYETQ